MKTIAVSRVGLRTLVSSLVFAVCILPWLISLMFNDADALRYFTGTTIFLSAGVLLGLSHTVVIGYHRTASNLAESGEWTQFFLLVIVSHILSGIGTCFPMDDSTYGVMMICMVFAIPLALLAAVKVPQSR